MNINKIKELLITERNKVDILYDSDDIFLDLDEIKMIDAILVELNKEE
jgi:hypothetical protein